MTDHIDVSRWPAPQEGESHEQLKIMLAGKPYIAIDAYLGRIREEMATKMYEYNRERSGEKRTKMLESMATLRPPKEEGMAQNTYITTPFTFEYVSTPRSGSSLDLSYEFRGGSCTDWVGIQLESRVRRIHRAQRPIHRCQRE